MESGKALLRSPLSSPALPNTGTFPYFPLTGFTAGSPNRRANGTHPLRLRVQYGLLGWPSARSYAPSSALQDSMFASPALT